MAIIFHTFLLMVKGFKLGYTLPAVKGLCAGLFLVPQAIIYRFYDVSVHETKKSKEYKILCDPPVHHSVWGRIVYRLKHITEK